MALSDADVQKQVKYILTRIFPKSKNLLKSLAQNWSNLL